MLITAKKKTKSKTGRQAKITASGAINTAKPGAITKPSPFAEIITPEVPEYCAEKPKKKEKVGKPSKKEKDDPTQKKLDFTKKKNKDDDKTEGGDRREDSGDGDRLGDDDGGNSDHGDGSDGGITVEETVAKKSVKVTKKRAPKRTKKALLDSEQDMVNEPIDLDSATEEQPPPLKKKKITVATKKPVAAAAKKSAPKTTKDTSDGDFTEKKKPTKKPVQAKLAFSKSSDKDGDNSKKKKTQAKKTKAFDFSDNEDSDDIGGFSDDSEIHAKKSTVINKRKPTTKRVPIDESSNDSDSDIDDDVPLVCIPPIKYMYM